MQENTEHEPTASIPDLDIFKVEQLRSCRTIMITLHFHNILVQKTLQVIQELKFHLFHKTHEDQVADQV